MPRLRSNPEAAALGQMIGKIIRIVRKNRGMKASTLAEFMGTTEQAVSAWERGKVVPEFRNFISACLVLKIAPSVVLRQAEYTYNLNRTMAGDAERLRSFNHGDEGEPE